MRAPWTESNESRYQYVEFADRPCTLYLQRSVNDSKYEDLPAPVAYLAFMVSNATGGKPFVNSRAVEGVTTQFLISFDYPGKDQYAVNTVAITYSSTARSVTMKWRGEQFSSQVQDCPSVPAALSPTGPTRN